MEPLVDTLNEFSNSAPKGRWRMVNRKSAQSFSPKYKCYSVIEELGASSVPAHPNKRWLCIRDLASKFVETDSIKYLFWRVYFMKSCKSTVVSFWVMQWVSDKMDNIIHNQ